MEFLPEDALLWIDWLHPYITNFIYWELERSEAASTIEEWLPVAIEAEAWDDDQAIPWMGFADAIVPVASIAEIDGDDGVVIVDFKTGSTPDKKYRNKGIFLEGEYYGMLFREDYNVQGVAGYFPKNNDFIVSELSEKRRQFVRDTIAEIHECGTEKQNYIPDTGPLCRWSSGDDEQCDYYSMCHAGKEWGGPADREDEFRDLAAAGVNPHSLADQFTDGDVGAVYYWKSKFNV